MSTTTNFTDLQLRRLIRLTHPLDYRATPVASVINYAHRACGEPLPAQPLLHQKLEAIAAYDTSGLAAIDSCLADLRRALANPEMLLAFGSHSPRYSGAAAATAFARYLRAHLNG